MNDGKKKTILLVEDEAIIAVTQKKTLENYGYKLITADTGEKAIDIFINNNDIDLILMDIDLGKGLNGPDTAIMMLKEREIPIVFLSSHTEKEVVEKTEKITSYGYVVKNSGITVLDASIKMAMKLFYSRIERLRAIEELRLSETRISAILSSMNDIIFEIDLNGCFEGYHAPKSKNLYVKPDYFLGKKYNEILPENVSVLMQQAIDTIYAGKPYQQFEYHLTMDNAIQWEHAVITPRYNNLNEIIGVIAVCRDITERKNAEEALQNSESKYREIVENAPMGIFRRELAGDFLYINPGLIKQFDCKTEKELLDNYGLISQRWVYPERYDEFKALLLKDRRVYGFENELRLVEGTTKWFALYSFIDDSNQFINGFSLDITERKRAEKLLYESNELYRKLTETTIMGVWQVKIDGSTVYTNPAMKLLLEADNEDVFANRHYYSFFTDESIEIMKREQMKRSQGISSIYEVELIGIHGKRRNVVIAGAPVFSINGELAGLIGSFIDITELKNVKEKLQKRENSPDLNKSL